jgi:hypothetical protein
MDLSEYRKRFRVLYKDIARGCDCTPEMISLVATGKSVPSFDLAVKIEKATNNLVPRDNWYPPRPPDITITIGATSL